LAALVSTLIHVCWNGLGWKLNQWIDVDTSVAKQALSAVVTLTLRATPITWVLKCLREVRVYLKSGIIDSLKLTHMHFPQL